MKGPMKMRNKSISVMSESEIFWKPYRYEFSRNLLPYVFNSTERRLFCAVFIMFIVFAVIYATNKDARPASHCGCWSSGSGRCRFCPERGRVSAIRLSAVDAPGRCTLSCVSCRATGRLCARGQERNAVCLEPVKINSNYQPPYGTSLHTTL